MKNKILGKEINELYEWMRFNWPSPHVPNKRQKNELKSILKAAVNRRTKNLQKRLMDCQNELHESKNSQLPGKKKSGNKS